MTTSAVTRPKIVVGVDGSAQSQQALRWAARLAKDEGAAIEVVTAWVHPSRYGWAIIPAEWDPQSDAEKATTAVIDAVFGENRPADLTVRMVSDTATRALLEAGRHATMIVVGNRGSGGFAGLLLGSVSRAVAEHATVPVLVIHGGP